MKFRDYFSGYMESREALNKLSKSQLKAAKQQGIVLDSFESLYALEMKQMKRIGDVFGYIRNEAELAWYRCKRPYFNVFPFIENKLLKLDIKVSMSELHLPFKSMEIRTQTKTFLVLDTEGSFVFIYELGNRVFQEFAVSKKVSLQEEITKWTDINTIVIDNIDYGAVKKPVETPIKNRMDCIRLTCGVCLLSGDKSIIAPVVLADDKRDVMTPEEMKRLSEKAIRRTGRIGFNVGQNIEKLAATSHYRSGCFAKYYVGREHELYPPSAKDRLAAVMKWRTGAIVNEGNLPKVPTGFKDAKNTEVN